MSKTTCPKCKSKLIAPTFVIRIPTDNGVCMSCPNVWFGMSGDMRCMSLSDCPHFDIENAFEILRGTFICPRPEEERNEVL